MMKIKEHIDYKTDKQVWRILISDSEKIIIEKRDVNTKEVLFDIFDLNNKKVLFTDLQLEEKFWIGIEKVYKDIIYFHKFPKPDMPGHKEIIAYDIQNDKILWTNEEYAYLFIYDDKVYVFKQQFEGRKFYTLDYKSGEFIEEIGDDAERVNLIYDEARKSEDYSHYQFPLKDNIIENKNAELIINDYKKKFDILGEVEYNIIKESIFLSYHNKAFDNNMVNKFAVVDIKSKNEIFNETLSANTDSFMPDSFFIYKDFLFLLIEKNEVKILQLINGD